MTSKRQPSATSKTRALSFPRRDVIISMERTSQPDGAKFTIERKAGANITYRPPVVVGRIMETESGTTLSLVWSEDVTALEMVKRTEGDGYLVLAIARPTSK